MTYVAGSKILANDYLSFRGPHDALTPYANDGEATNKLSALIGVGYGIRGYGQNISFPAVSTGQTVTAAQWNTLRSVMNLINVHTGAGLTLQPTVSAGNSIRANDGSAGRPNLSSLISSLDAAKLTYDIGQMQNTSKLTSTRNTSWNTQIVHEFTIDCSTENLARYFFNSGGTIFLTGSRTGGSVTGPNTSMSNLLNAMGTIKFAAQNTTYTGSGGTVYAIGYYGLTGNYQTLFHHAGSGMYYAAVSYTLQARRENYVGANGANGSLIRMQAIFDAAATLDGTISSFVNELKEDGGLTIASPTFTTISNL
jgi:hypothetical protein